MSPRPKGITDMASVEHDLAAVNHALGLASPARPSEYDEDDPRDYLHSTHTWVGAGRWRECAKCGQRDYWPGGERPCPVSRPKMVAVDLSDALTVLAADLHAFGAWWRAQGHPSGLPSVDEWAANFLDWRIRR